MRKFTLLLLAGALSMPAQTSTPLSQMRRAVGTAILVWLDDGKPAIARLGDSIKVERDESGRWVFDVVLPEPPPPPPPPPSPFIDIQVWSFFPALDQTTFTVPKAPDQLWVFRNGILLTAESTETFQADYSISADRTVVTLNAVHAGIPHDVVAIVGFFK